MTIPSLVSLGLETILNNDPTCIFESGEIERQFLIGAIQNEAQEGNLALVSRFFASQHHDELRGASRQAFVSNLTSLPSCTSYGTLTNLDTALIESFLHKHPATNDLLPTLFVTPASPFSIDLRPIITSSGFVNLLWKQLLTKTSLKQLLANANRSHYDAIQTIKILRTMTSESFQKNVINHVNISPIIALLTGNEPNSSNITNTVEILASNELAIAALSEACLEKLIAVIGRGGIHAKYGNKALETLISNAYKRTAIAQHRFDQLMDVLSKGSHHTNYANQALTIMIKPSFQKANIPEEQLDNAMALLASDKDYDPVRGVQMLKALVSQFEIQGDTNAA